MKKNSIRKLTALVLTLVLTLSLAACSAGGVPVIAHPSDLTEYVQDFLNMGVMGFEFRHPDLMECRCKKAGLPEFFKQVCEDNNLYKMGGCDHSGILGGNLDRDPVYTIPDYYSGICEEDFMNIYERKLG